ncbi:MAG TPA: hypothetical protein VN656_03195 [Stellaceae bacterium]|nr:hypothetical protein [Stellaceae bacterium]
MAAKKKPKSKAKPKRPVAKPKSKTKPASKSAAKRVQPKAKRVAAGPKKVKPRAVIAKPQPKAKPAESPKPVPVALPPAPLTPTSPTPTPPTFVVRPGLQKRADMPPIGVVRVTDGYQLIEESTFYSAPGRDEYVQRWEARGYTCRFTPTTNGSSPD